MNNEIWLTVGIIGCVFMLMNAIFLGILVATQRKMKAVQSWSATLGAVSNSFVERRRSSKGGSTSYPVVHYSYQVNGEGYLGRKIAPGMEVGGSGAGSVVSRYPAGAQVMVFYDPENPSDAVLERKAHAQWVLWLVLVIMDMMLCSMAIVFGFAFSV
jgi:hypothetical protein